MDVGFVHFLQVRVNLSHFIFESESAKKLMKLSRARQRFKNDSTEQTTKIVFQTSSDTMAL